MERWARRDVLRSLIRLPLLAGVTALLAACGGGSSGSKSNSSASDSGGSGTTPTATCADAISANHGHTACIAQSVLGSPQPTNIITLTTGSGHTHEIALTDVEVMEIKNNAASVVKTSTVTNSHTHDVTYLA